jgi:hypothetical protein
MGSLESELCAMKSFEAIKYVLNDIELHDIQCIDVMKMLYAKKSIVSYDTGTGKTLLMAAAMQLLWNEDAGRRFIVFVKKDQLNQTPKKLQDATGKAVLATDGQADNVFSVFSTNRYLEYPILMLTHSCLRNHAVMKILFSKRSEYYGVFIDEAHEISNRNFAQSADIISGMISRFDFACALTATPITTDTMQMSKLANIMKPEKYSNVQKFKRDLDYCRFNIAEDPTFFINRSGKELGRNSTYNGHVLWVPAMSHQTEEIGGNALMLLCKGDGAIKQAEALVDLVKAYEGKRGLVYVNQHAVRDWILPFFDAAGIKYGCINGKTKTSDDNEVMRQFNDEKSLDVVITSCTTAIDLDCDFVIFYEFTVMLKQMIGRADRGLAGKTVDVWYVITKYSYEPLYFKKTIVDRSDVIKRLLKKDYAELDSIASELESEVADFC